MDELQHITWWGHASFSFEDENGNRIYYIDPFDLANAGTLQKADIVFVTHAHYDHCSPKDVQKIIQESTAVVAPLDCLERLSIDELQRVAVSPNQMYTVRDFPFQTIPAYNIRPERLRAHPKENNWVGYIFTLNGKRIYHAGDTDFIPEMHALKNLHLDVAMMPMGGTYTMDVNDIIQAANVIGAKITVPMHYKRLLGNAYKETEEKLKRGVINSKVVILEEVQ